MSKIRKTAGQALFILVILVSVLLIGSSLLPRAFGYVPCGIHDDSMEPMYSPGTLVLARPVAIEDISPGDVLVFKDLDSSASFTRVVRQVWLSEQQIVTSSAATTNFDPRTTPYRCVVGRVTHSIPLIGYPAVWVHTIFGKILLGLLYIIWIAVEIEAYSVSKRRETSA